MIHIVRDIASNRTALGFQESAVEVLRSLEGNHDPETVANALISELPTKYDQTGMGVKTGFLAGEYWTAVKKGLDTYTEEPSDDPCQISREIILVQSLKRAHYTIEEAIAIMVRIRGRITVQENIHIRKGQVGSVLEPALVA